MVQVICTEHNVTSRAIEVGCNTMEAFNKVFEPGYLISPNHTQYDLTYAIQSLIKVSPIH